VKLCECGCGRPAPIAKATYPSKGHVKGQPVRFITGHNHRGKAKSEETRKKMAEYAANRPLSHHEKLVAARRRRGATSTGRGEIHSWLNRHHPKTGVCEECGRVGKTDYSFQRHPEQHTHDRTDYRELCRSCHVKFDLAIGYRKRVGARFAA